MTDRVKGLTITLDKDYRDDDVEYIINAIKMIKGVIHVEPSIVTPEDHMARERIYMELRKKYTDFILNDLLK